MTLSLSNLTATTAVTWSNRVYLLIDWGSWRRRVHPVSMPEQFARHTHGATSEQVVVTISSAYSFPSDHQSFCIVRRRKPQLAASPALGSLPRTRRSSAASHFTLRRSDSTRLTPPRRFHPSLAGVFGLLQCHRNNHCLVLVGRCWGHMHTAFSWNHNPQITGCRTLQCDGPLYTHPRHNL
jgi:hypothetical protein